MQPWLAVLIIGLLLWGAAVGSTFVTADIITLPTIAILGSFLVPVTAVVWYLDHDRGAVLSLRRVVVAFVVAGTLSILAASLLEFYLLGGGSIVPLQVAVIEELDKAVFVVFVAYGIRTFRTRDGMALGAAVGFGFAALESTGYALAHVRVNHFYHSLDTVLVTELARGVLAPFGHGMWTAIVGGVIFAVARGSRLRSIWALAAVGLVIALHAAFDSIDGVKGYVIVSIIGLVPLVWLWLRADRPFRYLSVLTNTQNCV